MLAFVSFASTAASNRFNCTDFSVPPVPVDDVRMLHPGHISYVASVGDSITAAFSARSTLKEDRDISWSIGVGTADQLTAPFMLSRFNAKLQGMSAAAVMPANILHVPHGDYHPKTDHLNVAESEGAVHRNSMVEQWAYLNASSRKYGPAFRVRGAWKMITVFMTANDVCGVCSAPIGSDYLRSWVDGHDQLLQNVSSTFHNVYVNLMSMLDMSHIHRLQHSRIGCRVLHKFVHECGCVGHANSTELRQLDENVHTMNAAIKALAVKWHARLKARGRRDMAVVYQNFLEGIGPQLDISFLSRLDCFHPSTSAHEDLAIGLWNGMLCSAGRASSCGRPFQPNVVPSCPTNASRLYAGP